MSQEGAFSGTYSAQLRTKTILVTGATGFIGANLTRCLLEIGCNVNITVREEANRWRIRDLTGQVREHICDLRIPEQTNKLVGDVKPDVVYHLAAYGSYPTLQQDLNSIVQTNIIGTLNLIKALSRTKCEVLVNSGSSSEYGLKNEPMVETAALEPINHYGVSKAATSLFGQVFARSGQPIVTLRPFSVYGYYEEPMRLIPTLITSCLRGKDLNITQGEQTRDFVFIEDMVDAYLKASLSKEALGEIINIGSGIQHSVKEVVNNVLELCGNPVTVHWGALPYRNGETSTWLADNSKARQLLAWKPQTDLDTGLRKTIAWFRQNLDLYGVQN